MPIWAGSVHSCPFHRLISGSTDYSLPVAISFAYTALPDSSILLSPKKKIEKCLKLSAIFLTKDIKFWSRINSSLLSALQVLSIRLQEGSDPWAVDWIWLRWCNRAPSRDCSDVSELPAVGWSITGCEPELPVPRERVCSWHKTGAPQSRYMSLGDHAAQAMNSKQNHAFHWVCHCHFPDHFIVCLAGSNKN